MERHKGNTEYINVSDGYDVRCGAYQICTKCANIRTKPDRSLVAHIYNCTLKKLFFVFSSPFLSFCFLHYESQFMCSNSDTCDCFQQFVQPTVAIINIKECYHLTQVLSVTTNELCKHQPNFFNISLF